ncbi:hypothetical protein B0H11DRAFT_2028166 [Mycena galericulata]|nr:hypothetical protein B0H11DRAFT_2028166 [Mycena galericulata]
MLDHYYTPRDLPAPDMNNDHSNAILDVDIAGPDVGKPHPPRMGMGIDLRALSLEQLCVAFDCDDDDEDEDGRAGSDDGYVSTLLRLQRQCAPALPRRIAGARRVARAVSAPQQQQRVVMEEVDMEGGVDKSQDKGGRTRDPRVRPGHRQAKAQAQGGRSTPEGELFQSITAIPGLESTSFEVRCLSFLLFVAFPSSDVARSFIIHTSLAVSSLTDPLTYSSIPPYTPLFHVLVH